VCLSSLGGVIELKDDLPASEDNPPLHRSANLSILVHDWAQRHRKLGSLAPDGMLGILSLLIDHCDVEHRPMLTSVSSSRFFLCLRSMRMKTKMSARGVGGISDHSTSRS
jgi:hypothetical protein